MRRNLTFFNSVSKVSVDFKYELRHSAFLRPLLTPPVFLCILLVDATLVVSAREPETVTPRDGSRVASFLSLKSETLCRQATHFRV